MWWKERGCVLIIWEVTGQCIVILRIVVDCVTGNTVQVYVEWIIHLPTVLQMQDSRMAHHRPVKTHLLQAVKLHKVHWTLLQTSFVPTQQAGNCTTTTQPLLDANHSPQCLWRQPLHLLELAINAFPQIYFLTKGTKIICNWSFSYSARCKLSSQGKLINFIICPLTIKSVQ